MCIIVVGGNPQSLCIVCNVGFVGVIGATGVIGSSRIRVLFCVVLDIV